MEGLEEQMFGSNNKYQIKHLKSLLKGNKKKLKICDFAISSSLFLIQITLVSIHIESPLWPFVISLKIRTDLFLHIYMYTKKFVHWSEYLLISKVSQFIYNI